VCHTSALANCANGPRVDHRGDRRKQHSGSTGCGKEAREPWRLLQKNPRQKHTSDLERSLVLVSWSAWTNLRCLVGRRPSNRPGTIRGAPFRAHAHDPTGESSPTRNGFPIHFGIRHEFRRTSPAFLLVRTVAGSSKLVSDPILANRFSRPCGSLPWSFDQGRDPLEGFVRTRHPLCSPPSRFTPRGEATCGRYTRRCTSSAVVLALTNRHLGLVHD
jgi:hypothetical protein